MNRRILLVDDEPLVLQAIARNLRRMRPSWELVFAASGSEAIEAATRQGFDAIVLDYRMPGPSGVEAAKEIRAIDPRAACVMLTGHADLSVAMQAVNEAQVMRFLTKPCGTDRLIEALEAACAQHDRLAASDGALGDGPGLGRFALARLPFAAFQLAPDGRVAAANDQGERLLADGALLVRDSGRVLRAADPGSRDVLERARRNVAAGGGTEILRLRRQTDGHPHGAAMFRLEVRVPAPPAEVALALVMTDASLPGVPDARMIGAFFELTTSEARLVHALLRGLSLQEAAVDAGITINSARTYLRHVFAKLGVGRQAELVRAVLTSPLMLVAGEARPDQAGAA